MVTFLSGTATGLARAVAAKRERMLRNCIVVDLGDFPKGFGVDVKMLMLRRMRYVEIL